jgi:hypothetical protein
MKTQLTVFPSLTPPTAFLAFQQSLATPLAVALQGLFARLERAWLRGSAVGGVERDGEGGASAACGGGDVEGLQSR